MSVSEGVVRPGAKTYDGTDFIISKRRWRHITDRHPELRKWLDALVSVAE